MTNYFTDIFIGFTSNYFSANCNYIFLKQIFKLMSKMYVFSQKAIVMLLFLVCSFCYAQTGVVVKYLNGNEQQYNVATAGKLYFADDNLVVKQDADEAITTIPVSIISKVTFVAGSLGTAEIGDNSKKLMLYPNPGTDVIRIHSATSEKIDVKIYSLMGQMVLSGSYSTDSDINISAISPGIYMVQAEGVTLKFMKK